MAAPVFEAIIFDCFGVLYTDTKQSLLEVVPAENHRALADLFTSNNYGYFDKATFIEQVAEITGLDVQQVEAYISAEHHLNRQLISLITDQLRPRGYKIGLLSNIGRGWIDQFFDTHQLHNLFDEVLLSGEEHITKPDSKIFLMMAERMGVEPERCLMIDDIAENCDGAVMAGMDAVQFRQNEQLLLVLKELNIL